MHTKFNPDIHHRKSIRLKEYDYSHNGAYFVTLCVNNMMCLFGDVVDGKMGLNDAGKMVQTMWNDLSKRFPEIQLDVCVIMPNHVHGIISIVGAPPVGAQLEIE
jgi:REP element-mobilizing transposase RayT